MGQWGRDALHGFIVCKENAQCRRGDEENEKKKKICKWRIRKESKKTREKRSTDENAS